MFTPNINDKDNLLKERYKKFEDLIKIYHKYRKNFYVSPPAPKFYARHECFCLNDANPDLVEMMMMLSKKGPKTQPWPLTENQCYGWYNDYSVEDNRNDRRYFQPRVQQDCTKNYEAASKCIIDKKKKQ